MSMFCVFFRFLIKSFRSGQSQRKSSTYTNARYVTGSTCQTSELLNKKQPLKANSFFACHENASTYYTILVIDCTVLDINLLCIRYEDEPKAFLLFNDHSPS